MGSPSGRYSSSAFSSPSAISSPERRYSSAVLPISAPPWQPTKGTHAGRGVCSFLIALRRISLPVIAVSRLPFAGGVALVQAAW